MGSNEEREQPNLLTGEQGLTREVSASESEAATIEVTQEKPEQNIEQIHELEQKEESSEEGEVHEEQVAAPSQPTQAPTPSKDPVLKGIEDILADDLTDLYLALPEERRTEFKTRGEEVALKITQMARAGQVKVRKILDLIRGWLRLIPGVNRFFLEQEAKIKADKISDFIEEQQSSSDL